MEKLRSKYFTKLVTIAFIIISMLFSNFIPIISYAQDVFDEEGKMIESEDINFDVTWSDNSTELNSYEGKKQAKFSLQFNTYESLQNAQIKVSKADHVTVTYSNKGEFYDSVNSSNQIQYFKTIPGGTIINGTIDFTFAPMEDYSQYSRDLVITLSGSYEKNGTTYDVEITKNLSANITTREKSIAHTATIESEDSSISTTYGVNTSILKSVNAISATYPLSIAGKNVKYTKIELEIYRTGVENGKKYYPKSVELLSTVSNTYFNMSKVTEENEKVKYIIERGVDNDIFAEEDLYNYSLKGHSSCNIRAKYDVDDAEEEISTKLTCIASFTSKGYTQTYNSSGTTITPTTITDQIVYEETKGLYSYTPDVHAWGSITINNTISLRQSDLENFLNNDKLGLKFKTILSYNTGELSDESWNIRSYNGIEWSDNSKSKKLTEEEMYVKEIKVETMPTDSDAWIRFYKKGETEAFFTATSDNLTYTVPDDTNIGEFYAVANKPLYFNYSGWTTTYELSASKIMENGLSETDIRKMKKITNYAEGSGYWLKNKNMYSNVYVTDYENPAISYFRIATGSTLDADDSNVGQKEIANLKIFFQPLNTGMYNNYVISNTNPIFYVILPDQFDYEIQSIEVGNLYNYDDKLLTLKNSIIKKVKGKKILEIQLDGKYMNDHNWSKNDDKADLKITYYRKLKTDYHPTSLEYYVYMKTEENRYYNDEYDSFDVDEDSNTSIKLGYSKVTGSIKTNSQLKLYSMVYSKGGEATVNEDIKLNPGETAKYRVQFDNDYANMSKLELICRLPFADNKSIIGETINLNSNLTLTNLKNITVSGWYNHKTLRNNLTAEIKYSTDENANYDSEFYSADEIDMTAVKTMKVVLNESNAQGCLYKGSTVMLEFEMDIPEGTELGKKACQISAGKYYKSNGTSEIIESSKSTVIVGEPLGKIEIKKVYQRLDSTADVSNITFRLENFDDETQFYEATTDEEGYAVFDNVPTGEWKIKEVSENLGTYAYEKIVRISNGEQYTRENNNEIVVTNVVENGRLTVRKLWEGTGEKQWVQFSVVGTTVAGYNYSERYWISADEGVKSILIPYGTYVLKEGDYANENEGLARGWYAEDVPIVINQEEQEAELINKMIYGNLEVRKTVPEGDNVKKLKFRLFGKSEHTYINEDNERVNYEIYEEGETDENGIIRFENILFGTYTLEEIDMPEIQTPNGLESRYKPYSEEVEIKENGETVIKNVENKWKTGVLNVIVTANEGADLSLFKVKVEGTSYYGESVLKEYNVPESGILTIEDLNIGEYKVSECNTREIDGKIFTYSPDGYEVTYNPEYAPTSGVRLETEKTSEVRIRNEYSSKGYIKIEKSLEDETDVSKAEGIQFRIKGKNDLENSVDEVITIGADGTGISGEIPVGKYLLTEIEETVPEIYQIADEREVTVRSDYTNENPGILEIEDKLAIGNIILETELKTGGYPETPIKYSVTKVDNDLNPIGSPVEVQGDENSHAELENLKAGLYLVEQKEVPAGYVKDTRQVVQITRNESGYALFIIDKKDVEEFEKTRVTINKKIVNEKGEDAEEADYIKAKIDVKDKYSFEVKIQNVDTKETYYSFVDEKSSDVIAGLPYGTYEVEEIYKPKFKLLEITGSGLTRNEETGKITFTLSEDNSEADNSIVINIKNAINYEFGFGGQDYKDNLSKVLLEDEETSFVTQAKVYIRDDEGNKISDATFILFDSNENVIKFAGSDGVYIPSEEGNETLTPENGSIILKALPVGKYTLRNVSVNSNFLKANDRVVTIYPSAVGIRRIELLRNIPRGNLKVSTVYTNELNVEKFAPNSKYKILNKETGEALTFIKRPDGTYERSNLPEAQNLISLRYGVAEINNIEAGITCQIGLTGVADEYGIIDEAPVEEVIEAGETYDIKVSVAQRKGFKKVITSGNGDTILALDKEGKIWIYEYSSSSPYGYEANNIYGLTRLDKISSSGDISNITFKDINGFQYGTDHYLYMAIDSEGKVWNWGNTPIAVNNFQGLTLTCVSDALGFTAQNIKIKQVAFQSYQGEVVYFLDEQGLLWYVSSGTSSMQYSSTPWIIPDRSLHCLNNTNDFGLENVRFSSISNGCIYNMLAIDTQGKVWSWGNNYNSTCGVPYDSSYNYGEYGGEYIKPTCISMQEGSNIQGRKFIKTATGNRVNLLLDTENKLWVFGSAEMGKLGNGEISGVYWNPICLNNGIASPLKGKKIIDVSCQYNTIAVVDEDGYLYTWGEESTSGSLGLGVSAFEKLGKSYSENPLKIGNNEMGRTAKLVSVCAPYYGPGAAIDSKGNIWAWKEYGLPLDKNVTNGMEPSKIIVNKNAYFDTLDFAKVSAGYNHSLALDKEGRIWAWGSNSSQRLGTGTIEDRRSSHSTPILVGGNNNFLSQETIVDISAGGSHSLALDSKGQLWVWGDNYSKQLGVDNEMLKISNSVLGVPTCISKLGDKETNELYGVKISKIKAGQNYSVVIDEEGYLYAFGKGNVAKKISTNIKFKDVSLGDGFAVAIDINGKLYAWGDNTNGKLGNSDGDKDTPYALPCGEGDILNGKNIVSVSAGVSHCLALDSDGNVYAWGKNLYGESGPDYTGTLGYVVRQITGISEDKIVKIAAGSYWSLAMDEKGKIYTWGGNTYSCLGQMDTTEGKKGIKCINEMLDIKAEDISIGSCYGDYCLIVDKDGKIWSWGSNNEAKAGHNTANPSVPRKLQGITEILNPETKEVIGTISGEWEKGFYIIKNTRYAK